MNRKIVVIDVGCRWGVANEFFTNAKDFYVYGFDPDVNECKRLSQQYPNEFLTAIPLALGDVIGEKTLFLTKEPACSSLYQPDPFLIKNYPAFHCEEEVGQTKVNITTLDNWVEDNAISDIDFIKIDTQGSELDILKGGISNLKKARAIQVEVEFNPMYLEQPLFSDIDLFLREQGFILWKFSEITHYSKNKKCGDPIGTVDIRYDEWISQSNPIFAGQIFWANAHYVNKDVLREDKEQQQAERDNILFSAIGMPDVLGDQELWSEDVKNRVMPCAEKGIKLITSQNELSENTLKYYELQKEHLKICTHLESSNKDIEDLNVLIKNLQEKLVLSEKNITTLHQNNMILSLKLSEYESNFIAATAIRAKKLLHEIKNNIFHKR